MLVSHVAVPADLDLRRTTRAAGPCARRGRPDELWWATRTPHGAGTLHLARRDRTCVEARAWGDGAEWMIGQAPVGDLHLPHAVCWALAGEPRGGDSRMLELLEPYRGHRGRVLRLITDAGLWAPRRGSRLAIRDIRRS